MSDKQHAGGGGSAGQPTPAPGGPVPADVPDDLRALLPEGFELPEGVILVQVPPVTPEDQVRGAWEHASMERGIADAAAASLAADRAAVAGHLADGQARVDELAEIADAAEERARGMAAEYGVELPGEVPRHPTFAFLDQPADTGAAAEGGDRLWPSALTPRS